MAEKGIGDFFISDADEVAEIGGVHIPPVIVPSEHGSDSAQAESSRDEAVTAEPEPGIQSEAEASPLGEPLTPAGAESESTPARAGASVEDLEDAEAPVELEEEEEIVEIFERVAVSVVEIEPDARTGREDVAAPSSGPSQQTELPRSEEPVPVPATSTAVPHETREERLIKALNKLMDASEDVEATALVSLDGFIMAAALPEGMHEDKVGAMSAAILGLGERAAIELGRGSLTQVFIEGEGGYVLLVAVGDRAVLTVLAGEHARLGLVIYDMRAAAETIARLLG